MYAILNDRVSLVVSMVKNGIPYQPQEKSSLPTSIQQTVKFAPAPRANSSLNMVASLHCYADEVVSGPIH
ncbi:MAG: hypothetical protein EKK37_00390 [Sphingobacteriales bacterium]|nr:MAG: hypothetical protein EKK37_00390 [Sphingobacteriales bacterium]